MKDKLLSIFVAFVRKTFTKDRLLDLIDDLLDVVYDRFAPDDIEFRMQDQEFSYSVLKEELKDV